MDSKTNSNNPLATDPGSFSGLKKGQYSDQQVKVSIGPDGTLKPPLMTFKILSHFEQDKHTVSSFL